MLETLALLLLSALTPPLPMVQPRDCRVSATELELIVRSGGAEARYPLSEREVPSAPGATREIGVTTLPLPGATDTLLAALRETWSGVAPTGIGFLYTITCGPTPSIEVAMRAPGIAFGQIAVARDGRWVVGGWGGLRVLDPVQRRLTPLTSPPPYPAPACWSAVDGKPAPAADVPLVGPDGVARARSEGPHEIAFMRAGACGYEAELRSTRHALLIDRGIVRRMADVTAFWRDGDRMLVGETRCGDASAPALWSSLSGGPWTPLTPGTKARPGIARVARLASGRWLALTSICRTGGGLVGGDLLGSFDLVTWEPITALPDGMSDVQSGGAGLIELQVRGARALLAVLQDKAPRWFSSTDGSSWTPVAARMPPPVSQALAERLGVDAIRGLAEDARASYAWTDDGLWQRAKDAGEQAWVRIFPR